MAPWLSSVHRVSHLLTRRHQAGELLGIVLRDLHVEVQPVCFCRLDSRDALFHPR